MNATHPGPSGSVACSGRPSSSTSHVAIDAKASDNMDKADDQFQPVGEAEALARIIADVLKQSSFRRGPDET